MCNLGALASAVWLLTFGTVDKWTFQCSTGDKFSKKQSYRKTARIHLSVCPNVITQENYSDHILTIPETEEIYSPILTVVPLQLLAYYIGVKKGCNVDQPRNLAKSVTVE